ncbi:MAG: HTTM domain-containing protein [Chitinophagales bacterium]|nr:HTTM domain-containing protein [Chitinophagales bacterium]
MRISKNSILSVLYQNVSIAPLISCRIIFGLLMLGSTIRFYLKGWIEIQYIQPEFLFSFIEGMPRAGALGMYLLFFFLALSAFFIAIGFLFRLSSVTFFLIFTYIELLDKTNYLNHYYFVSLISFLLAISPAGKNSSIDNLIFKRPSTTYIPFFQSFVFKLMIGILYFYAGIAKINGDWLLHALPLKIWLQAKYHTPIIGNFLTTDFAAYFFSWAGCLFDITIFFFLLHRKTRISAWLALVFFHIFTSYLFPIGVFPYLMIGLTIIFFGADFHESIQRTMLSFFPHKKPTHPEIPVQHIEDSTTTKNQFLLSFYVVFFTFQLIFPFRYLLYPGNLFWTEQGYRFSWRVMLMEKAGYATFWVHDGNKKIRVENDEYLTKTQIKMMSTQPDMMVQYAHHLKDIYRNKGILHPKITVEAYVALNGKGSQPYIDPEIDLSALENNWKNKNWILPYENK